MSSQLFRDFVCNTMSLLSGLGVIGVSLFVMHINATTVSESSLKMVHILYRHGDRAPLNFYPNDPHINSTAWPEGLGQLTKRGKAGQYSLGRWLRQRYPGFISDHYKPDEIYVRSTDYDRTLMSAQSNLASFYIPEKNAEFEEGLNWLPTPVHAVIEDLDVLLNVDKSCPRIEKEVEKLNEIPLVKKKTQENKKFFKYLSFSTGLNVTSIEEASHLYDTLYIEQLYNLTLPKWANQKTLENMESLFHFSFGLVALSTELKRLRSGPLIKDIRSHMELMYENNINRKKMYVYSAHDTTVSALLLGLGIFNNRAPPYATTVIIELNQKDGSYFVQIFLKNDTTGHGTLHKLTLPGCEFNCPLQNWLDLTSSVVPDNWAAECQTKATFSADTLTELEEISGAIWSITPRLADRV